MAAGGRLRMSLCCARPWHAPGSPRFWLSSRTATIRRILPRVEDVELLSGDTRTRQSRPCARPCLDNRRALDWLQTRPDIDPTSMGVAGISLGGILAPLIAGVDHRAKVLVTIVGGGDVSDLVYDSFHHVWPASEPTCTMA